MVVPVRQPFANLLPNTAAFDPGGEYFAAAVASFAGELLFAKLYSLSKAKGEHLLPAWGRAMLMAQRIFTDIEQYRCDTMLFEGQTDYVSKGKDKVSGNDLFPLAWNSGVISTALAGFATERFGEVPIVSLLEPTAWKGTIKGEVLIRRTKEALTVYEKQRMLHHNDHTYDAVAFAKWHANQRQRPR